MSLKIIQQPLINNISLFDVILFPMGINNSMNRGFSYEIALNFHSVKESENNTKYGDKNKYGTVHCTKVKDKIFAACYIHNGGYKKDKDDCFLNYEYLEQCLRIINNNFKGKKICSQVMGQDMEDGCGDKNKILTIFEKICKNIDITLFDYEQRDFRQDLYNKSVEAYNKMKNKEITPEDYHARMRIIRWESKNGILNPIPDEFEYKPKSKKVNKKIRVTKETLEKN